MTDQTSLFPDLDTQCTRNRRHSTDRNGEYVFQCQLPAAHAGPCQHRWRIHPVPEPEAAA